MKTVLICAATALCVGATVAHANDAATMPVAATSVPQKPIKKRHHQAKKVAPVVVSSAPQYQAVAPIHPIPPDLAPALVPVAKALAALPFPDKNGAMSYMGVTVYGGLDSGLGFQSHGAPLSTVYGPGRNYIANAANYHTQAGLMPNALSYSNIGIKATEEIIPGLSVVFNAQTTFLPTTGALSNGNKSQVIDNGLPVSSRISGGDSSRDGQIDNSQAYGGLSSPTFGTLTFGRQNSLTLDGVIAYDPMSASNAFSLIGFAGFTPGGGNTEDARLDDALKYRVNFGPFRAGGIYKFDTFGNSNRNAYQAQLGGEYAGFSFDAIYSVVNDSVTTGIQNAAQTKLSPQSLTGTVSDNYAFMLLASYKYDKFKFYGGYENVRFTNPANPLAAGTPVLGGYILYPFAAPNNTAYTKNRVQEVFWGGLKYTVRPDIDLIGAYYHYTQNSYATGANLGCTSRFTAGSCAGTEDAGSVLIDYRVSKYFDIYAGALYTVVHGGLANGYAPTAATATTAASTGGSTNSIDPMVGARVQF